jgi:hypothetical protein
LPHGTEPNLATTATGRNPTERFSVYFPDNPAIVMWVADLQRLKSSPAFSDLAATGALRGLRNATLLDLGECWIQAGSPAVGIVQAKRPLTPEDVKSLMADQYHWSYPPAYRPETIHGHSLYVAEFLSNYQPAYCLVDARVVLLGSPDTLRGILRRQGPAQLSQAIRSVLAPMDPQAQFVVVADPQAFAALSHFAGGKAAGQAEKSKDSARKPTAPDFPILAELLAKITALRLEAWCDRAVHARAVVKCADAVAAEDLRKVIDGLIVAARRSAEAPKGLFDSVAVANQEHSLTATGMFEPSALVQLAGGKPSKPPAARAADEDLKPDSFYWTHGLGDETATELPRPFGGTSPLMIGLVADEEGRLRGADLNYKTISSAHPFDALREELRRLMADGRQKEAGARLVAGAGIRMRDVVQALGLLVEFNTPGHAYVAVPGSAAFRVRREWSPADAKTDDMYAEIVPVPLQVTATKKGKIAAITLNEHSQLQSDLGQLSQKMLDCSRQAVQAGVQVRLVLDCDPEISFDEANRVIAAAAGDRTKDGPRRFIHSLELVVRSGGDKPVTVFFTDPSWSPELGKELSPPEIAHEVEGVVPRPDMEANVPSPEEMDLTVPSPDSTPSLDRVPSLEGPASGKEPLPAFPNFAVPSPGKDGGHGIKSDVGPSAGGIGLGGFGRRGSTRKPGLGGVSGGTKQVERAVAAALAWLARHQNPDGSWSLQKYADRCTDKTCTGPGDVSADSGATAMGVLAFLAADQTHKSHGPYRKNVDTAINWLIRNQKSDGNLASGAQQMMYSQGLATIALCEAYGLTGDASIRLAAQNGANFIINAQNKATGGWRYNPSDSGDTSVVGWQIAALLSANLAGLQVSGIGGAFDAGSKWLDSCKKGANGNLYCYLPDSEPSNSMTSIGLLCRQHLGAKRDSPMLVDGVKYLMQNLPDPRSPNVYYWYYATQVMHNHAGDEWDTWNRAVRKILVESQCRAAGSCANGSWDPKKDPWGRHGGRIMTTALGALTLEICYRYLPLFKTDGEADAGTAKAAEAEKK